MQREDARKPDSALLPARKLVRIKIEMRLRETHLPQEILDATRSLSRTESSMNDERLFERAADGPARIERIARVLVTILQARRHCAALAYG